MVTALGNVYEVGDYTDRNSHDYDSTARSLRWEFTRVPKANFCPTHLRVLDGIVVAIILSPALESGAHTEAVALTWPADEEEGCSGKRSATAAGLRW